MIHLYYDSLLLSGGGIVTYFHALVQHLHQVNYPYRAWVNEIGPSPLMDDLQRQGAKLYRQRHLRGDRWQISKRVLQSWMGRHLQPGDWVFAACPPDPAVYLRLARICHRRGAKLAVSWFMAPEFWPLDLPDLRPFTHMLKKAVAETDLMVSVSECTKHQFAEVYGYTGPVAVIPYHNLPLFDAPLPMPAGPPWKIGYAGRLEARQKNLDGLIRAFAEVPGPVELHLYGGGPSEAELRQLAGQLGIESRVFFHGRYDFSRDLRSILSECHFFVYPSRSEGGPCFSVLEIMQAGRFCVASDVGGLPDLYAGHPEAGLLLPRENHAALVAALNQAIEMVKAGGIDGNLIRARYFDGFDMESVHRRFCQVFGERARGTAVQASGSHQAANMKSIRRVMSRVKGIGRYVARSYRPWDAPRLAVLGIARHHPLGAPDVVSRLLHRMYPTIAVRPASLRGHALELDPDNISHMIIFDEVFIDRVYDLSIVRFQPDLILDCGAHIGMFTLLASAKFPQTKLLSFEPNPNNIAFVKRQLARNRLRAELVEAAVSAEDGEAWFAADCSHGGAIRNEHNADTYRVQVMSLGKVITQHAPQRLLLKIDTEGEEVKIIPAVLPLLPAQCVIFLETHDGTAGWQNMAELLRNAGFAVHLTDEKGKFIDGVAVRG